MKPRCLLTLAVLLMAACASPVPDQKSMLERVQVCCASLGELPYRGLDPDKPERVDLDGRSPAYVFDTGKSYFYAARLPDLAPPFMVVVRSQALQRLDGSASVLRPAIMLVDGSFNPTRRVRAEVARRSGRYSFETAFFVNPENAAERYMVVYAETGRDAAERVTQYTPLVVPMMGIVDGVRIDTEVREAPTGKLEIVAEAYRPAVVKK